MKTIIRSALVFLLTLALTNAYSQQGQRMSAEDRAKSLTEWMTKELKLDEKMSEKVQEINLKYAKKQQEKMEEIMESGGDRSQFREIMQKFNDEKNKEFKPLLGDEKYEQYLKLVEERRQSRGGGGQGNRN